MRRRNGLLWRGVCRSNATDRPGAPIRQPLSLQFEVPNDGVLSGANQGSGKGADQCCSADAKKELLGPAHSLGF